MITNQTEVMSARELKMLEDLLCGLEEEVDEHLSCWFLQAMGCGLMSTWSCWFLQAMGCGMLSQRRMPCPLQEWRKNQRLQARLLTSTSPVKWEDSITRSLMQIPLSASGS
ncbi:unnamed protein product [Musa acuminata var. zebrina]